MIGILGGMGPLATVDLMRKIIEATPAERDQDHLHLVVYSDPRVPDRTEAFFDPRKPSPVPAMLTGIRALERDGASAIVIACNTAHHWIDELRASIGVPILHIAEAVSDRLQLRPGTRVGLLATSATIATCMYQAQLQANRLLPLLPERDEQEAIMCSIRRLKQGDVETARTDLQHSAAVLFERGAAAIILACTEIPIALASDVAHDGRLIDATECLAAACVAWETRVQYERVPAPRPGQNAT